MQQWVGDHPQVAWIPSSGRVNLISGRVDAILRSCGCHPQVVWIPSSGHVNPISGHVDAILRLRGCHPQAVWTQSSDRVDTILRPSSDRVDVTCNLIPRPQREGSGQLRVYLHMSSKSVAGQVERDATLCVLPIDHVPQGTEEDVQHRHHDHARVDHTLGVLRVLHLILQR